MGRLPVLLVPTWLDSTGGLALATVTGGLRVNATDPGSESVTGATVTISTPVHGVSRFVDVGRLLPSTTHASDARSEVREEGGRR